MADDSELDYIADFLRKVHKGTLEFTDTVASVTVGTKSVVMTAEGGTLNQWAGYKIFVHSGDNAGLIYTVASNNNATPTTLITEETFEADLATDIIGLYYYSDAHTVATIETVRNINFINDTQSILVNAGRTLSSTRITIKKQYQIEYRDATEGALNSSVYALNAGIEKLNTRIVIPGYTKPTNLIGMNLLLSSLDIYQNISKNWYTTITIITEWLTQ